jgi:hypothetical protein
MKVSVDDPHAPSSTALDGDATPLGEDAAEPATAGLARRAVTAATNSHGGELIEAAPAGGGGLLDGLLGAVLSIFG